MLTGFDHEVLGLAFAMLLPPCQTVIAGCVPLGFEGHNAYPKTDVSLTQRELLGLLRMTPGAVRGVLGRSVTLLRRAETRAVRASSLESFTTPTATPAYDWLTGASSSGRLGGQEECESCRLPLTLSHPCPLHARHAPVVHCQLSCNEKARKWADIKVWGSTHKAAFRPKKLFKSS